MSLKPQNKIQRINIDELASMRITNQEYEGRIDYFVFTRIEFYNSRDALVAQMVSHNEDMVQKMIARGLLKPKRQQLTFEEFIDLKNERIVGIKIGCLKTGIPTGM